MSVCVVCCASVINIQVDSASSILKNVDCEMPTGKQIFRATSWLFCSRNMEETKLPMSGALSNPGQFPVTIHKLKITDNIEETFKY